MRGFRDVPQKMKIFQTIPLNPAKLKAVLGEKNSILNEASYVSTTNNTPFISYIKQTYKQGSRGDMRKIHLTLQTW